LWYCLKSYKPRKIIVQLLNMWWFLLTLKHHDCIYKTPSLDPTQDTGHMYILRHRYFKIHYDIIVATRPKFQPRYWLVSLIFAVLLPWLLLVNLKDNCIKQTSFVFVRTIINLSFPFSYYSAPHYLRLITVSELQVQSAIMLGSAILTRGLVGE